MQGPCIIAVRSNLHPQFFVCISPLVHEPKMLSRSHKTKRPTHIKASTRTQSLSHLLRHGPARRSTPTNPTGPVRVGCVPLLFCTVIWCLTCRPGCYMSHMSATGSTEFMKGSVDGGVYYRIHESGRLSFGKICFYGVHTH